MESGDGDASNICRCFVGVRCAWKFVRSPNIVSRQREKMHEMTWHVTTATCSINELCCIAHFQIISNIRTSNREKHCQRWRGLFGFDFTNFEHTSDNSPIFKLNASHNRTHTLHSQWEKSLIDQWSLVVCDNHCGVKSIVCVFDLYSICCLQIAACFPSQRDHLVFCCIIVCTSFQSIVADTVRITIESIATFLSFIFYTFLSFLDIFGFSLVHRILPSNHCIGIQRTLFNDSAISLRYHSRFDMREPSNRTVYWKYIQSKWNGHFTVHNFRNMWGYSRTHFNY